MSKDRSTARGQHHVPLMLQASFTAAGKGKKRQIYVFDKHNDRVFRTSPGNILHERDFNTFENDGEVYCLEDYIGKIESRAAPALHKLIARRTLACLDQNERSAILSFTALQRARGVHMRASLLDIDTQIRKRLRSNGDDPSGVPQLRGSDEPGLVKLSALRLIEDALPDFTQSYENKIMILMAACPGENFLLGDTPVVLANHNDTSPRGNLGLEVKGIEIYMPISPDLALAFFCPSLIELMELAAKHTDDTLKKTSPLALLGVGSEADQIRELRPHLIERAKLIRNDLDSIRGGMPLNSTPENMNYINSLQVIYAERYILSSTGNFSLVRSMIDENDEYRGGHRFKLA